MNQSELIERINDKFPYLTPQQAKTAVVETFEMIGQALEDGHRVEIRNFGVFIPKRLAPRRSRNPRTGVAFDLGPRNTINYKPGRRLHGIFNKDS
ncbi:MAG: integration host factor subunit beta [Rhodobacteraceae bacterium]|nr:integration host factor subunit beta [Paracoccaceae bacterium]